MLIRQNLTDLLPCSTAENSFVFQNRGKKSWKIIVENNPGKFFDFEIRYIRNTILKTKYEFGNPRISSEYGNGPITEC